MRRLMLFLVMAPLALATVPATAQTQTVTCPEPPAGATVVGPNYAAMPEIETPLPTGSVTLKYQLDLSPATAENKASVGAYLEWEVPTSDFDLYLLNADGGTLVASERGQPVTGSGAGTRPSSPYENVFRMNMAHCTVFQVEVANFAAPAGPAADALDPLQLEVEIGATR